MTVYMTDGTLMQREVTPAGGTYATIPQCTNIKGPKRTRKSTEVFTHDSSIPITKLGIGEGMECTFDVAFDPGNAYHQAFFSDWDAKTDRSYQIILTDTGAMQERFTGAVTSIEPGDYKAEGDALSLTVTIKVSSAPVITW